MPRVRPIDIALVISLGMATAGCVTGNNDPDDPVLEARSYLKIMDGDGQTGVASSGLGEALVVRYFRIEERPSGTDTIPGPDIFIDWTVEQGGGSLGSTRTGTDANGVTQNTWVLGPGAGSQTVRATVNGASVSVTFSATATAVPPPPPPGVASVTVSPQGPTVQVNQTTQLTAAVTLQQGATGTPVIEWTSADESKATVAANGTTATVTGQAAGDVVIKAKATLGTSTAEGTTTVHVVAPPQAVRVTIQVNSAGTGSGQVTSSGIPGGDINCTISTGSTSGECQASFGDDDGIGSVTLTAAATSGSTFGSWVGCGQGSSGSSCVLPWNATGDVTLTATVRFDPPASPPILGVDEMIVFANDSDGESGPSTSQIWVMTNSSTAAVTSGGGINTEPAWSPDGSRIAFRTKRTDVKGEIWVMNADGSGAALLSGSIDFDHDPDWSSTNRVVWVSDRRGDDNLYMVDVSNSSTVVELTSTPGIDELDPAWSPDGSRIAYIRDDFSGSTSIFVMNADGSGPAPLTSGSEDEDPSWSPDGTKIVFSRNDQIWMMNADGSGQAPLTSGASDGSPVFSPDGTKVAFTRGPTNAKRIYVLILGSSSSPQALGPNLPGESEDLDWVRKP